MIRNRDVANIVVLLPDTRETLLQKKTLDYPYLPVEEGRWFLFGGCIEDESHQVAARREFLEETGIDTAGLRFSHESSYHVPDRCEGKKYVWVYETDRDMRKYTIGEGAGIAVFAMPELADIHINKWDNEDLQRVLNERKWVKS